MPPPPLPHRREPVSHAADRPANVVFGLGMILAGAAALALLPAAPPPREIEKDPGHHETVAPGVPAPVLEPAEALASLRLAPGLRVNIAASEPAVLSPVVAAFDEDGRLWVAEMRTYMRDLEGAGEQEPRNRVLVLEDTDQDGSFENSTVFLDDVALPRGIAPCFGGALVIEPPWLLFCKDTDGDGRADVRRKLLDGFTGLDNPEHAANSLLLGIDNWYHLSQHNVDFRFDGETVQTRPSLSHGQWGITQDTLGRIYTTPNSDPLLIDLVPRHYGARNPFQNQPSFLGRSIVPDKSVYPAHSTPGVNRGYQAGVLREDQTLRTATAACGPAFYDAASLGGEFRGSAFVCEPAGNVVKRYVFDQKDGIPRGTNPYHESEFLASTDERFRPVNALVGPDGALYVLDMYRGIIQHKLFVTPYLRSQILARGLQAPVDRGRIYRIAGTDAPPAKPAWLSRASDDELVRLLAHPDQWWRLSAQRLLVEQRARATAPLLRRMRSEVRELTRLHAFWTLDGIGAIEEEDVLAALADVSPAIRAAGLRVAEHFLRNDAVSRRIDALEGDPDQWVRVQRVCTLGELPREDRLDALARLLHRSGTDRFIRDAAISGLKDLEQEALQYCVQAPAREGSDLRAVLDTLADCILRKDDAVRTDFIECVASLASDQHPAAGALVSRIRAAQRLDSDKPRPISLSRAPTRWIGAMGERFNSLGVRMGESEVYFDWPDRPPVRRVHGTRPMTSSELARFERGRIVYAQSCVSCHMGNGRGTSGLAPSLAASPVAEGSIDRFAGVLIHGLEGTWRIGDLTYEAAMPPAPVPGDDDLAAVMTFVRRSFGNAGDPVTPEDVARARAAQRGRDKPWTRAEIEQPEPAAPSN